MTMMGPGLLMMFIGLVVVIAIVAIAVWGVIHFSRSGRSGNSSAGDSRQVLDQRYARGEIDEEEYQRIRRELG
jgi:putative membrane protein